MYNCGYCHTHLRKGEVSWWCPHCGFAIPYSYRGYRLSKTDISYLLKESATPWIHNWHRKDNGSPLSGRMIITKQGLVFQPMSPKYAECPLCKGRLLENIHTVYCSTCSLEIWKKIAGKELEQSDIHKLILYRKTDVIEGFVQKESGKYFSAQLNLLDDGSVSFS